MQNQNQDKMMSWKKCSNNLIKQGTSKILGLTNIGQKESKVNGYKDQILVLKILIIFYPQPRKIVKVVLQMSKLYGRMSQLKSNSIYDYEVWFLMNFMNFFLKNYVSLKKLKEIISIKILKHKYFFLHMIIKIILTNLLHYKQ